MAALNSDSLTGLFLPISSKQLENLVIGALGNCIGNDGAGLRFGSWLRHGHWRKQRYHPSSQRGQRHQPYRQGGATRDKGGKEINYGLPIENLLNIGHTGLA